jgi:hypothetical protein
MKYRKKPVVIDAFQLKSGILLTDIYSFFGVYSDDDFKPFDFVDEKIIIKTLEGEMTATDGDYIIKGIKGEFYPCKADIFEASYEICEVAVENKNSDTKKEEIFAVMVEGRQTPSKMYSEQCDAENEAKRLALKERLTTYTVKAVSKFSLNDVIKTIL